MYADSLLTVSSQRERKNLVTVSGVRVKLGLPVMEDAAAYERLGDCQPYNVVLDPTLRDLTVDRNFMSVQFGGQSRGIYSESTVGAGAFIFPTCATDPHLPTEPGFPGFLCRVDKEPVWKAERLRVFVGLREARFRYVGEYELASTTPVSIAEYKACDESVSARDYRRFRVETLTPSLR